MDAVTSMVVAKPAVVLAGRTPGCLMNIGTFQDDSWNECLSLPMPWSKHGTMVGCEDEQGRRSEPLIVDPVSHPPELRIHVRCQSVVEEASCIDLGRVEGVVVQHVALRVVAQEAQKHARLVRQLKHIASLVVNRRKVTLVIVSVPRQGRRVGRVGREERKVHKEGRRGRVQVRAELVHGGVDQVPTGSGRENQDQVRAGAKAGKGLGMSGLGLE
mmetsp:Transcript_9673/g.24769  ORF Transcript_9673/g.24769 Transcript_9673/m.24769 type:complete len:215 (+) Transcript_9673:3624-4268(+)